MSSRAREKGDVKSHAKCASTGLPQNNKQNNARVDDNRGRFKQLCTWHIILGLSIAEGRREGLSKRRERGPWTRGSGGVYTYRERGDIHTHSSYYYLILEILPSPTTNPTCTCASLSTRSPLPSLRGSTSRPWTRSVRCHSYTTLHTCTYTHVHIHAHPCPRPPATQDLSDSNMYRSQPASRASGNSRRSGSGSPNAS